MKPIFKLTPATLLALAAAAYATEVPPPAKPSAKEGAGKTDRSGKTRHGQASFYAKKFTGKKMADGTRMNPQADIAASKTLPLGTTAQVTNLENGKSAVVEIRDRGPYEKGRIVDLSPKTAEKLDITDQGVAPVAVKPLALPPADETKPASETKPAAPAKPESRDKNR